mmetsp:Transcript_8631/g.18948  ORF Transcript_8631/g.18948 Transcript_8631/m.18948 type:complete len:559 (-) Transcript_8631:291-1967(-)
MATWPLVGGEALTVRSCCGLLLAAAGVTVAVADRVITPEDLPRGGALQCGAVAAAAALAVQIAVLKRASEGVPEGAKNEDASLTWREDDGVSKLAPLLPEAKGAAAKKPLPKFTTEEVAKHNARDDLWIIVDERVYDVTNYVDKHPGGWLPMVDMAGKDCTDVFANYHAARVYKHMLPAFLKGECVDVKVPEHVKDFRAVRQELLRRGLFETDMRFYLKMGTWLAFLLSFALYLTLACTSIAAHMSGAVVLGVFWQQLAGVGHDLGHSGVTHKFWLDHLIGSCAASLMGISTCWWKRNHNTHHVVCNSIEHDPDIQHMPILAVTPRVFEKPFWSTYYTKWVSMDAAAKFLVSHQHLLFYPVMMVARFNLYAQSWIALLSNERLHYRKVEICALLTYATWVLAAALSLPSWGQTVSWLLISHAVGGILHVQIVISHWAMQTYHGHAYNDAEDEWYITQLKTTMNVATPPALDWIHIGLQFQIEHHLYPRLPRHNLRHARELVQAVCEKHKIHYHEPGFFQANVETCRALYQTACTASKSKKGEHGFYESALWDGLKLSG